LIWYTPRFEREMRNIEKIIEQANAELWNAKGLNVLSPRDVALQYVSCHRHDLCQRSFC
jgi:hypothetical protein